MVTIMDSACLNRILENESLTVSWSQSLKVWYQDD